METTTDKVKKQGAKVAKTAKKAAVSTAKSTGKAIVKNPISTLYVVGGLIALVVGYKFYQSFSGGSDDNGQSLDLSYNPNNLSITEAEGTNLSAQLLNAMSRYGTDLNIVEAVFDRLQSADDFKLVAEKFGTKLYNGAGLPPEGLPSWLDGATPLNLVDWLTEEVGFLPRPEVYNKIKDRVNSAGFVFA